MAQEFRCSTCGTTVKYGTPTCPECGKQFRYEAPPRKPKPPVFPVRGAEPSPEKASTNSSVPPSSPSSGDTSTDSTTPQDHHWKWAAAGFAAAAVLFAVVLMIIPGRQSNDEEQLSIDSLQMLMYDMNIFRANAAGDDAAALPQSTDPDDASHLPGPKVVMLGDGVRLRFKPSLESGYLVWEGGHTRSVSKGTKLLCLGETNGWYKVKYRGKEFYVSKQYSRKVK